MTPPRGRPIATAVALLLCASSGFSQTSGASDSKFGAGARGLVLGAIRHMEKEGHPGACLSGIGASINQYTAAAPNDPSTRSGAINVFSFNFWSPTKPHHTMVFIKQPVNGGPAPQRVRYNEYDPTYIGGESDDAWYGVRPTCIPQLLVDTGKAIEVAAKNGLPLGTMSTYVLWLIYAASPDEADWNDRTLRKKIFWIVTIETGSARTQREYLVDALTGKFIKARTRQAVPNIFRR